MSTLSPTHRDLPIPAAAFAPQLRNREMLGKVSGFLLAVLIVLYPPRMIPNLTINGADIFILIFAVFNLGLMITLIRMRIIVLFGLFYAIVMALSFYYSTFYFFEMKNLVMQSVKNAVSIGIFGVSVLFFLRVPAAASSFVNGSIMVTGILAFIGVVGVFIAGWEPRATATFDNPNAFGAYLLFGYACVLVRTLTDRVTPIRAGLLFLMLLAFLATGSRGALMAAISGLMSAAAFIVYFYSANVRVRRNSLAVLVILFPVAAVYLIVKLFLGSALDTNVLALDNIALTRINETMGGDVRNLDKRLLFWTFAWNLFEASPWVGVGIGQFERFTVHVLGMSNVTHNTYLSFLAEGGIMGFAACLGFIAYALNQSWIIARAHPQLIFCGSFLIALFVQGMVTNIDNFRILWVVLGLTVACVHSPAVREALIPRRDVRL